MQAGTRTGRDSAHFPVPEVRACTVHARFRQETHTLEGQDLLVRVHEGRVGSDGPPQRLHRHGHVDNDDTVGGGRLAHADELLRLHCDMRERHELLVDAQVRELQDGKGIMTVGADLNMSSVADCRKTDEGGSSTVAATGLACNKVEAAPS